MAKNPRKRIPEFIEPFRVEPESKVTLPRDFDPAFKAVVRKKKEGASAFTPPPH